VRNGFSVTGYDINPWVPEIYRLNRLGQAFRCDLRNPTGVEMAVLDRAVLITGGPPCRPWSCVNVRCRREAHPDHTLIRTFFALVLVARPEAFLMENVPPLGSDPVFLECWRMAEQHRYDLAAEVIRYSDYGAATARHRLIVVGFRKGPGRVSRGFLFFQRLREHRRPPRTVMEVLSPYLHVAEGEFPDHVWPHLRTIEKYTAKYESRRFGWYRLASDRPAPSFGSVMKTYTLHPLAGNGTGFPTRVISVREAMAIMGFDAGFRFPEGMSMKIRYQMVSDAVSPVFATICGRVMREMLG